MSRSLLEDEDSCDENQNTADLKNAKTRSVAPSEAGSNRGSKLDMQQKLPKASSANKGSNTSVDRPGSALSEQTHMRKLKKKIGRDASMATSEPADCQLDVPPHDHKISIQSLERIKNQTHRASTPLQPESEAADGYGSRMMSESAPTSTPSAALQPAGWRLTKIAQVLLSRYTIPGALLIAAQVAAIVAVLLVTDIITYNSVIQLTNVDSMLSHIGIYASVVNSYLTTHAQMVSEVAQGVMVQEFNPHLHHIAKIKAIVESDVVSYLPMKLNPSLHLLINHKNGFLQNWSLLDYSNKKCVLEGKLVEHCTYQVQNIAQDVMPCQSFPIEAIQYTGKLTAV